MSASSLPGFRDFYPEEFAQRAWLFERWRDVARRFAFVEVDGPPLEPLELYTKKSGEEIVGQLYNFTDKGGREVALRPEMTPTVARMVGAKANALRKPVRWFSIPQLFRYERQQKGRLKEHFQLNVDIFGEADVSADAELLAVACEVMRACGLGPDVVRARWSDRVLLTSILRAIGVPDAATPAAFAAIDKIYREERHVSEKRMVDAGIDAGVATNVFDTVHRSDREDMRNQFAGDHTVIARLEYLREYNDLLARHAVGAYTEFDLRIVRGLDYYTGIVFELFDEKNEFRAICGGGRYDTLLSSLGGADLPALGFGMGDVVLGELLKARDKMPTRFAGVDAWVAPIDADSRGYAVNVAAKLRAAGASVELPLREQALAKQLKAASVARVADVVFVGPAYVERDEVEVKELAGGTQTMISVDALVARYRDRYRGAADRP